MDKIAKALPVSKQVTIGDEVVHVCKLPLGQYGKLLIALKKVPGSVMTDLQGMDTDDNNAIIGALLGVFGEAWGQIIDIISIGSGIDKERLENDPAIGLDGGIELFMAIWEVNNLGNVFSSVKNVLTRVK